ncbi:DUF6883 domain-containing protein [Stenotrophomonas maltophilia]|uniref:DUF6883 domain-containing protein n=1 Tax=Stenotrophomonas maltophilia TaxID=40324 RepID=UPI0028940810|nr:DUF6883 domain-containing protein [Stenotrophomonas maltophilia]MDT3487915.1 hypothetical protein [Stenotrophomonas maltophilia]
MQNAGVDAVAERGTKEVPNLVEGVHSLVGANRAVIDPRKLTDYALNRDHAVGGNKARVFESVLGFTKDNSDLLMKQLQEGVMKNVPTPGKVDQYGARFTVDIPVVGPKGSGHVSAMIYSAVVEGLSPVVEEEVSIEILGERLVCFASYLPFRIEVGETYQVELSPMVFSEYVVNDLPGVGSSITRRGGGIRTKLLGISKVGGSPVVSSCSSTRPF